MAEPQVPVIARSALTGNVYAVTKYEQMSNGMIVAEQKFDVRSQVEALVGLGEVGDGFHTMPELYDWRLVLQALLFNAWSGRGPASGVLPVKSWRHSDGHYPFGDTPKEWFIVSAELPGYGQVTNHYRGEHWDLFDIPEVEKAPAWDGHTAAQALERLTDYLKSTIEVGF